MKSFIKRPPQNANMALQITSMADIFIIILVFLLKSFASGSLNITPAKGTVLPEAKTSDAAVEALKVEIADKAVLVEGVPAASMDHFSFDSGDLEKTGVSKSLNAVLAKERKRQLLISKANSEVKVDAKVIILADKHTPYNTVKTVLATAAQNGYTDFKLAVVNNN